MLNETPSQPRVEVTDLGLQHVADAEDGDFEAYVTLLTARCPKCNEDIRGRSMVAVNVLEISDAPEEFRASEDRTFMKYFETEFEGHVARCGR